ncbi:MAG: oligopeptide/dipeptide ABC transporter ATP-binding protein [Actinomycetota bacterium]
MAANGTTHLRPDALLKVEHLVVEYPATNGGTVHAVSDVSFDVREGEVLGLVGESGCGKSTTARAIVQFVRPVSGSLEFEGRDLMALSREEMRKTRSRLQMIFQDPISSLHPKRVIEDIIGEGLRVWGIGTKDERAARVREVMEAVGLEYNPAAKRRPSDFSGGQCQRISIARALVLEPKVLVCDEPVSALDVSVQAQILNLLSDMRDRYALTMVFIAHDLAVVKHISDRVMVMYLGKICEVAPPTELHACPAHPYTVSLLASIPLPEPTLQSVRTPLASLPVGEMPSPVDPPSGCRFRTRCPYAEERCAQEEPELRAVAPDHYVACHFPMARPN